MKSHETAFHVINCHVPVCHAVVPSRKWTMWLFRYVIVISYKCSITSTEVAPIKRLCDVFRLFPDCFLDQDKIGDISCLRRLNIPIEELILEVDKIKSRSEWKIKVIDSKKTKPLLNVLILKMTADSSSFFVNEKEIGKYILLKIRLKQRQLCYWSIWFNQ